MEKYYYRIYIFLGIFLCLSGSLRSQDVTPLGNHGDFAGKFKNLTPHTTSGNVSVKISATQSLSISLNVKNKTGNTEIFIGEVDNESNATFYLSITPSEIDGNIVLRDKKIAYQYYSDAQGNPYIKQVDIHKILCIDYNKHNAAADTSGVQQAPAAGSTSYTLQSLPGAPAVALLDFDGQYVSGTGWNSGNPINAAPSAFTEAQVTEIWRLISEDYRPFNINITTDSTVFFTVPANRRQRCIFTPTDIASPGAGGVSYVNCFSNGNDNDTPCWVFNSGVKSGGEAGSHELGHTFGLSHDGTSTSEYYLGQGYWAPIMGASYYDILGQWSKGEYPDANNQEDDLAIISKTANGVTYRADEAGNTIATAKALTIASSGTVTGAQNYGIITTRTDIDVYSFTTSGGSVTLTVNPSSLHPDLNVLLNLTDAAGTILVTANPIPSGTTNAARTASLAASITTSLSAGTYYLFIDGTGEGDLTTGYSDYDCLGEYTISGTIPVSGGNIPPTVSLTAPASNAVYCSGTSVTLTATAADADGTVSKVEFFDGTTLIATLTSSPYTYNWTSAGAGTHSITAKATDNGNLATTSASVSITVNTVPAAPGVASAVTYCQNATASSLTATGTALKWYILAAGGTSSATAPTPLTTTAGTTNYYVSQTINNCESSRAMITITVNTVPGAPTVNTPVSYCQNTTAGALTATGTALKWYTASTGGTGSTTAPVPATTTAGTTNYYVSQTVNGCESARAIIDVTINAAPGVPTVNTPVSYCQNTTAGALTATGTALKWYTASTGGTGSTMAPVPATTTAGTTNYYVSQTVSGCESSRAIIAVTVNTLPAATITAGGPTTFSEGGSVLLSANTGTGFSYRWLNGTAEVGTGPNFTVTTAGDYSVEVANAYGCKSTSGFATVTVLGNQAPTITITAPADNTILTTPANVTLTAIATDADGTISKVDFYNGSTLLGTDPTASYNFALNNLPVGTYTITAVATDNLGASTTSAFITISVMNPLPTVSITAPLDGSNYVANAIIKIDATASDPNGTVTSVVFYSNGILLGTNTGFPYSFTWTNVTAGTYSITARATDNDGGVSTSSAIAVTVLPNQPSVISIISPLNNSTVPGNSVTINVDVTDPDGSIILVEFMDGTTVIGSSTTAPYSFTIDHLSVGTHVITVRVTDSNGGITISSPSTVSVEIQTGLASHSANNIINKIYPNPSNSLIQIETAINLESALIMFTDALGSELMVPVTVEGTNASADVRLLETGIYSLLITKGDFIIRKKIVIAR
jgi:hypothetical protein